MIGKTFLTRLACIGLLCAAGDTRAATLFSANLDGGQVTTPIDTAAFGVAQLRLNDARTELQMAIAIFGLDFDGSTPDPSDDVTRMHIHRGAAGTNGGIVFGLIAPNNDIDGDFQTLYHTLGGTVVSAWDGLEGNATTLTDQLDALLRNGLYLNVHTIGHPGGMIRGQILAPTTIPLPAAWALLLPALVFLGLRRRQV